MTLEQQRQTLDILARLERLEKIDLPRDVSARVYNDAAISITTSGTPQALTFNTERYDTDAIHSTVSNTSRLTLPYAGKWLIIGQVEWVANATGRRQVSIVLNNTTSIASIIEQTPSATIVSRQIITTIYSFAANDYVELSVLQTSGGALSVNSQSALSPEFMCQLLS